MIVIVTINSIVIVSIINFFTTTDTNVATYHFSYHRVILTITNNIYWPCLYVTTITVLCIMVNIIIIIIITYHLSVITIITFTAILSGNILDYIYHHQKNISKNIQRTRLGFSLSCNVYFSIQTYRINEKIYIYRLMILRHSHIHLLFWTQISPFSSW